MQFGGRGAPGSFVRITPLQEDVLALAEALTASGDALAAVELLEESTELVDRLWENTRYFKQEMKILGFDIGVSTTQGSL